MDFICNYLPGGFGNGAFTVKVPALSRAAFAR